MNFIVTVVTFTYFKPTHFGVNVFLSTGFIASRLGGKHVFGIGVLVTAVLTLLTPALSTASPYLLIGCRVLEGLFEVSVKFVTSFKSGLWLKRELLENFFVFASSFCKLNFELKFISERKCQ